MRFLFLRIIIGNNCQLYYLIGTFSRTRFLSPCRNAHWHIKCRLSHRQISQIDLDGGGYSTLISLCVNLPFKIWINAWWVFIFIFIWIHTWIPFYVLLALPFSFVGNTEIDVDIKKYYCRAGIKSIQVRIQDRCNMLRSVVVWLFIPYKDMKNTKSVVTTLSATNGKWPVFT